MSEEQEEVTEEVTSHEEGQHEEETPNEERGAEEQEVDPIESQARQQGWVSREEWVESGGDPAEWRDADIFLERGELYRKISNLSKQNKSLSKAMKDLADHHKQVAEYEREKVLSDLKRQKTEAMENQDWSKVSDLDDEMSNIKSQPLPEVSVEEEDPQAELRELSQQWVSKNPWYETDQELHNQANIYMNGYKAINPNASPQEVMDYAAKEIRRAYPHKFKPKETKPKVGSGERTTQPSSKSSKKYPSFKDLPFEYQKIAKNFEETGVMSVDKYIKELVDSGGLEW